MFNATQTQTPGPRQFAAGTVAETEWVRLPKAGQKLEGFGRSSIYELITRGLIRTRVLKSHKHAQRGIRLVHLPSLRAYIEAGEGEG